MDPILLFNNLMEKDFNKYIVSKFYFFIIKNLLLGFQIVFKFKCEYKIHNYQFLTYSVGYIS